MRQYCFHYLLKLYKEKQLKDIKILLDFITFYKIISNQSSFVSNRTTIMQCSKIQNEIYRSLVTIQYHAKWNNSLYRKVTSNKFCIIFLWRTWPGHCLFSYSYRRQVFTPIYKSLHLITRPFLQKNMCRFVISEPIWQHIGSKTLTTTTKLGVILLIENQHLFWSQSLRNTNDKNVF